MNGSCRRYWSIDPPNAPVNELERTQKDNVTVASACSSPGKISNVKTFNIDAQEDNSRFSGKALNKPLDDVDAQIV
jgi:hypothetical protein